MKLDIANIPKHFHYLFKGIASHSNSQMIQRDQYAARSDKNNYYMRGSYGTLDTPLGRSDSTGEGK